MLSWLDTNLTGLCISLVVSSSKLIAAFGAGPWGAFLDCRSVFDVNFVEPRGIVFQVLMPLSRTHSVVSGWAQEKPRSSIDLFCSGSLHPLH